MQGQRLGLSVTGLVISLASQISSLNVPSDSSVTWLTQFSTIWRVEAISGSRLCVGLVMKPSTCMWSCYEAYNDMLWQFRKCFHWLTSIWQNNKPSMCSSLSDRVGNLSCFSRRTSKEALKNSCFQCNYNAQKCACLGCLDLCMLQRCTGRTVQLH